MELDPSGAASLGAGLGIASITPWSVRKRDLMSQEDSGTPNFIPTDGAPRGRRPESHQESWDGWGGTGGIPAFIKYKGKSLVWGE